MSCNDAIGLYARIPQSYAAPLSPDEQREPGTTFRPYWVGDAAGQVAVLARNNRTGLQVWSGDHGYPGDAAYREFHRKDAISGMQYWRISGPRVDLGAKRPYEPQRAEERVGEHARHFAWLVADLLQAYNKETGRFGVISAAYDTELFGHWWFEGVTWLKGVLRELAKSETVTTTTATSIVDEHGPDRVLALPESSWGSGGNHSTWLNPDTQFIWPVIHEAERTMEELVAANPAATGDDLRLLSQIARELLLLESSDWPFLVTTGQAKEYAVERFREHVSRFEQLIEILGQGTPLTEEQALWLSALEERDNPFPEVDYRVFAERQGSAATV